MKLTDQICCHGLPLPAAAHGTSGPSLPHHASNPGSSQPPCEPISILIPSLPTIAPSILPANFLQTELHGFASTGRPFFTPFFCVNAVVACPFSFFGLTARIALLRGPVMNWPGMSDVLIGAIQSFFFFAC